MMSSRITESHVTISLTNYASCVHISFLFTSEKGTCVKNVKEVFGFETSHDRKAYWMVKDGLEFQTQEPFATLARGGSQSKLE